MKFKNEVAWADQSLELQVDEVSRKFEKFFLEWFTLAETTYEQWKAKLPSQSDDIVYGDSERAITSHVRKALAETESAYGFLSVEWIGQMLLLAYQHWKYGEPMEQGLSVIERRTLEQMAAVKAAELEASAATL